MGVTSVEQIKAMAIKEVEICGFDFDENQTITVKLRCLSLMNLVKKGKLPNQLLGTATELFENSQSKDVVEKEAAEKEVSNSKVDEMSEMIDILCENAMVEPTYEEVKEYLTDAQKFEIFSYTQGGLKGLDSFRKDEKNKQYYSHSTNI